MTWTKSSILLKYCTKSYCSFFFLFIYLFFNVRYFIRLGHYESSKRELKWKLYKATLAHHPCYKKKTNKQNKQNNQNKTKQNPLGIIHGCPSVQNSPNVKQQMHSLWSGPCAHTQKATKRRDPGTVWMHQAKVCPTHSNAICWGRKLMFARNLGTEWGPMCSLVQEQKKQRSWNLCQRVQSFQMCYTLLLWQGIRRRRRTSTC